MRLRPRKFVGILTLAALLGACAGDPGKYPSLAVRDAERITGSFAPTDPVSQEPVAPVADDATLAEIVESARSSNARFLAMAPDTIVLVDAAGGFDPDSNAWARAEVALAALTAQRSNTAIALGDIDLLIAEASTTFAPQAELLVAQQQVKSWVDQQDEVLGSLTPRGSE